MKLLILFAAVAAASEIPLLRLCYGLDMRKCFTTPGYPNQCQALYPEGGEGQRPKSGRIETGGFCMIYSDDKCLGDSVVLDESGYTFAFPFQPRSYRC
ncbi:hypothetical protein CDD80_2811 [Ophiocordyceps camponoti-rufipedis]|uniref:Uncharacterized protein n=1 Tax=Ophiocordyceps camponoti-rufipedis TaxID=2004952 RepID=A0A2C5ZJT5_9HYPO|nr:hypothetical protein CDD80_2811 [Ophiocordyceps camponoti-rufipedis]